MDQQVITGVIALALCAALALSYFRTRNRPDRDGSASRMKRTLSDFSDYYGLNPDQQRSGAAEKWDLVPLAILSALFRGKGGKQTKRKGD